MSSQALGALIDPCRITTGFDQLFLYRSPWIWGFQAGALSPYDCPSPSCLTSMHRMVACRSTAPAVLDCLGLCHPEEGRPRGTLRGPKARSQGRALRRSHWWDLHSLELTWKWRMAPWKTIFHYKQVVFHFHVIFRECSRTSRKCRNAPYIESCTWKGNGCFPNSSQFLCKGFQLQYWSIL